MPLSEKVLSRGLLDTLIRCAGLIVVLALFCFEIFSSVSRT